MAKVKHIQCNTLPAQLEPYAIYFERVTGKIVQTDAGGVPVEYAGDKTVRLFITFRLKLIKDGSRYTVEPIYHYGLMYPVWNDLSTATELQLLTHPYIKGFNIGGGYRLKSVDFRANRKSKEMDFTLTIIRKNLEDNIPYAQYLQDGELIEKLDIISSGTGQIYKHWNVDSDVITKNGDVITLAWKKKEGTPDADADVYVYNCGLLLEFEKD